MTLNHKNNENSPTIWIIGSSLLMDSVEICLEKTWFKNVVHLESFSPALNTNRFEVSKPDLIIFEAGEPIEQPLCAMLAEHKNLHLLSLDQNSNKIIAIDCFQYTTHSMKDLNNIIQNLTRDKDENSFEKNVELPASKLA